MNLRTDNWSGKWIAEKIQSHEKVTGVSVLSHNVIQVKREDGDELKIATMSSNRVDAQAIETLLKSTGDVDFVVNIPKDAYVVGDTFALADERNFGFGGVGDLFAALNSESVRTYLSSEFSFVLRSIRQHSKVVNVVRLDNRRLLIERKGLKPLSVLILNDYELTADHVRVGIERYGEFQAIVRSNPNSRVTMAASTAADESGVRIFDWGEFLGQLNREWKWKKLS
jgi:hypothetical protein